ncbi:MAG: InlB B-repeat-containing protein [Clostridia bacterium]|nr:InlB B-repeat-containing protein [Clostridia bacterium]
MKTFNKTRTFLTLILTVLLVASLVGVALLTTNTQSVNADGNNALASTNQQPIVSANKSITKAVPMSAVVSSGGVTTPVVPEKTGYIFAGWYLDEELTIPYEGELITADLTLYAAFTPITYKVILYRNHSSIGGASSVTINCTYDVSFKLERQAMWSSSSYRLIYWTKGYTGSSYTDSGNPSNRYAEGSNVKNLTTTQGATVSLYAIWEDVEYTLAFNSNGGTGTMASQTKLVGASVTLPENTFTRTGYTFAGWATSATGDVKYVDGASCTPTGVEGETTTLYAVWTPITYTLHLNPNGGDGNGNTTGVKYDQTVTLPSDFTRTGYTLYAWGTRPMSVSEVNQSNAYTPGTSVKNLTDTAGGSITLYAIWEANTYEVKFNGNGATSGSMSNQDFTYGVAQKLTANTFKRVYTVTYNYNGNGTSNTTATATATFNGWATSASGAKAYDNQQSVSNLTATDGGTFNLYANWTLGNVTLPTPTRTGYTFAGWAKSDGTVVGEAGESYTPSANVTLYAQWTPITYTLHLNPNGGDGNGNTTGVKYDETVTLPSDFTRTGYTLYAWGTRPMSVSEVNQSNAYTPGTSVKNLTATDGGTVTLYAIWETTDYTVKFNANGGEGTMSNQTFTYDTEGTLTANSFTREGYTFQGWATSANGAVVYTDAEEVTNIAGGNSSVTLYAVWKINTYTVTFIVDGEIYAVVTVEWGTPSEEVIGQAVNTVLYDVDDDEELPN